MYEQCCADLVKFKIGLYYVEVELSTFLIVIRLRNSPTHVSFVTRKKSLQVRDSERNVDEIEMEMDKI